MIEIGCGTGNHTQEFIKAVPEVTAIDIDKHMLSLAKKKLAGKNKKLIFKLTRIENIHKKAALIAALFNVISYIENFQKLDMFFKGVSKNLQSGGVFIFDAWNGIAAIRSLPQTKTTCLKVKGLHIHATLTPVTDLLQQQVIITYEIREKDGNKCLRSDSFKFMHKLWTPYEIAECAIKHQLQTIKIAPFNTMTKNATENDWKIIYIMKKIG